MDGVKNARGKRAGEGSAEMDVTGGCGNLLLAVSGNAERCELCKACVYGEERERHVVRVQNRDA